jgi:hypothetical protein
MCLPQVTVEDLDFICAEGDQSNLFMDFEPTREFLHNLDSSFAHYADQFIDDKSVNALNCRKSAILSQLLLRHKLITLGNLELSKEKCNELFLGLIMKYCQIFMNV